MSMTNGREIDGVSKISFLSDLLAEGIPAGARLACFP
jgi:hypothetical protein